MRATLVSRKEDEKMRFLFWKAFSSILKDYSEPASCDYYEVFYSLQHLGFLFWDCTKERYPGILLYRWLGKNPEPIAFFFAAEDTADGGLAMDIYRCDFNRVDTIEMHPVACWN